MLPAQLQMTEPAADVQQRAAGADRGVREISTIGRRQPTDALLHIPIIATADHRRTASTPPTKQTAAIVYAMAW